MFSIFRSSAGSGKTYTLVKEYLIIALKYPNSYKNILAITFTKKSTKEMKVRILDQLSNFSNNKFDSMAFEIIDILKISEEDLKIKAHELLFNIIYNYDYFNIKTIDSFFQDILINFSNEIGLSANFEIETDINYVIEHIIKKILDKLKYDEKLLTWLIQFSEDKIATGKNWNIEKEIYSIIQEAFSEKFVSIESEIIEYINSEEKINSFLANLNQFIKDYETHLISIAKEAIKIIKQNNLEVSDFLYGKTGVAGYLFNLSKKKIQPLTIRAKNALNDNSKWYSKSSDKKEALSTIVNIYLKNILHYINNFQEQNYKLYKDALAIKPLFYALGIVGYILNSIQEYRKENDVILISDILVFLNKIIGKENTPFIYEKIGNTYKHILIDEFQDVSNIQWQNLKPLVENAISQGGKAIIVGDPKQSIYRWRGSDSNLISTKVEKEFKSFGVENIYLKNNWRSSEKIIEFNNSFFEDASKNLYEKLLLEIDAINDHVIKNNLNSYLKDIYSSYNNLKQAAKRVVKENSFVKIAFFGNDEKIDETSINISNQKDEIKLDVSEYIINKIEELQKSGLQSKDITILVRNNYEALEIAQTLMDHKLSKNYDPEINYDYVISSSMRLEEEKAINIVIIFLGLIVEENEFKFIELLTLLDDIKNVSATKADILLLDKEILVSKLREQFINDNEYRNLYLYDIIDKIIDKFELRSYSKNNALELFQELVFDYCENEICGINPFLDWWDTKGKNYSISDIKSSNCINIMTIHQSKGLQFKAVVIPFCNWNLDHSVNNAPIIWSKTQKSESTKPPIMPLYYYKNLTDSNFIEEYFIEKINIYFDNLNLLYVAFTRAEDILCINILSNERGFKNVSDLIKDTIN